MALNLQKFQEYITNRYNFGVLPQANLVVEVGNEKCGDATQLYLLVNSEGIIEEANYFTLGCGFATVVGVIVTELIKGKPVTALLGITPERIEEELGELPTAKAHYSQLGSRLAEKAYERACALNLVPPSMVSSQ